MGFGVGQIGIEPKQMLGEIAEAVGDLSLQPLRQSTSQANNEMKTKLLLLCFMPVAFLAAGQGTFIYDQQSSDETNLQEVVRI